MFISLQVPLFYTTLAGTQYDWNYIADPSPNASLAFNEGKISISRGKMLGGTSGLNDMVYIRGNPDDFDYWEKCGNPTWGWKEVLPFYLKSENNRFAPIASNSKYHSTSGPLPVDVFGSKTSKKSLFMGAMFDLGIDEIFDINASKHVGIALAQGTIDHKTRASTAKAFLVPVKDRKNLHIIKGAYVLNLKYNPEGSVAGVRFRLKDKIIYAIAKKEVILAAGAIQTPKILMLSGIGPEKFLNKRKIKLRANLPVGLNYHDKVEVPFVIRIPRSYQEMNPDEIANGFEYFPRRSGELGSIGLGELRTFINTDDCDSLYPNIQIKYSYYSRQDPELYDILQIYRYNNETIETICKANALYDIAIIWISLLTPLSRGFVGLRDRDSASPPVIRTRFLAERKDVDNLVEGVKFVKKLLTTDTGRTYNLRGLNLGLEKCNHLKYGSDSYFECYVRNLVTSGGEPVGTTKMGPDCDSEAVVDWRLRVYNITGLRIVGAPIMPRIVRAPTYATEILTAEKLSHFIIEDWEDSHEED